MKLKIVPPRTGIQWVKSGVLTFFRQPLALSGLFFMFVAVMSVVSLVPVVGAVPGIGDAEVNLVWEPAWSPANMTDEARLELGML